MSKRKRKQRQRKLPSKKPVQKSRTSLPASGASQSGRNWWFVGSSLVALFTVLGFWWLSSSTSSNSKPAALAISSDSNLEDAGRSAQSTKSQVPASTNPSTLAASQSDLDTVDLADDIITGRALRQTDDASRLIDPEADGWETETFSEQTSSQLQLISQFLYRSKAIDLVTIADLVSTEFRCTSLRPESLEEVMRDEVTRVRRFPSNAKDVDLSTHQGASGLVGALRELQRAFGKSVQPKFKLKVHRVYSKGSKSFTEVWVEGTARSQEQATQITALWTCQWDTKTDGLPRLDSIEVTKHEETSAKVPDGGTWLVDCTEAVLGKNSSYRRELSYDCDHWVSRLDHRLMVSRFGHHGLAVGDVNGDGLDDLYICQPGGLPNRLYLHQQDGTVRDISSNSGVDFLDYTSSAILADLDNDGDQDLLLGTMAALLLFENDSHGVFTPRAILTESPRATSIVLADYDNDGRLDIYACRYRMNHLQLGQFPLPDPYHDANNGGRNVLYRNEGAWKFSDVTDQVGLDAQNTRFSLAAAWDDVDNDGDPDLYVANDFGRNCLYRNEEGYFQNIAAEAGVEDLASGMSVTWSDFNHDGLSDLYVSNMFSSAGNRIAYQRQFAQGATHQQRSLLQRHAQGNTLFQNLGDGTFRDVSLQAGVNMGRWAWASLFVDINNDSWDDLLVVNGQISTDDTGDL